MILYSDENRKRAGGRLGELFPGASVVWACAVDSGRGSSAACLVGVIKVTLLVDSQQSICCQAMCPVEGSEEVIIP